MIPVFKSFGVECITLPVSDIYMAFEKSMIDGALINDEVLGSMKIAEVVQYNTHIAYPTGVNTSTAMNLNSWNKLPPDIQKVFENNTEFWGLEMLKQMEKLDVIGRDFAKQKGVKFLEMPEADLKKIWAATEVEAKKAAAALDAQGKPGTAILNEARRIAKNYGAK
jgi:TRAP-type C4-dicarboxylate transport system substrate-binding protein